MRVTKLVGPMILVGALALGACSATSGTAEREDVPTRESAITTADATTMADPPDDAGDPVPPEDIFGTREAPLSPGAAVDLGTGWTIAVGATNFDATSELQKIDPEMVEPEAGTVFVSAPITLAFHGAGSGDPGSYMSYAYIGSQGNTFPESNNCAPYEFSIWGIEEMNSGATAEALLCISVSASQASGGVWRIQLGSMNSPIEGEVFYSSS